MVGRHLRSVCWCVHFVVLLLESELGLLVGTSALFSEVYVEGMCMCC